MKHLFNILERVPEVIWWKIFEDLRTIRSLLLKAVLVVASRLSTEHGVAAFIFAKRVLAIRKKSGLLFTALYLKQCTSCLCTAYGGISKNKERLPVFVKCNNKGYPLIIPSFHRKMIMKGDDKADTLVRLYLSWFTLSKFVKMAKPIRKSTFKSITDPILDKGRVDKLVAELISSFRFIRPKYLPFIASKPMVLGLDWIPTWKSIPTKTLVPTKFVDKVPVKWDRVSSIFLGILHEWVYYIRFRFEDTFVVNLYSTPLLGRGFTIFCGDAKTNHWAAVLGLESQERVILPHLRFLEQTFGKDARMKLQLGRLSYSVNEGGGKRRMFYIGNYIKQRSLKPVHDWASSVLRSLVNDGTFNQEAPLRWVVGHDQCFSYDLTAATDRWPVVIITTMLTGFFGPRFADAVCASLWMSMADVNWSERRGSKISKVKLGYLLFNAGQPLGLYSSWPLFALTHHFMVWLAAENVYGHSSRPFRRYAILGDDIVIADALVSKEYTRILGDLQVSISTQKSIVSDTGAFEFAKRFFVKRGRVDCSPVSLRLLSMSRSVFGVLTIRDKYKVTNLSTLARLHGGGYRVTGSIHSTKHRKWARLKCAFKKPPGRDPLLFEWWVSSGNLPNPYIIGLIMDRLRQKVKPRDLVPVPEELLMSEDHQWYLEYSLYPAWLKQYLKYSLWYHQVVCQYDVSLYDLCHPPTYEKSWRRKNKVVELKTFGSCFQCVDWYKRYSNFNIRILDVGHGDQQSRDFILVDYIPLEKEY